MMTMMAMARAPLALLLLALAAAANASVSLSAPRARSGSAPADGGGPGVVGAGGAGWPAVETLETAARHGICGGVAGSGSYENAGKVQAVFYAGSTARVNVSFTGGAASLGGFLEFRLCSVLTQNTSCVTAAPLARVAQPGEAGVDASHPGRWFLPPGVTGTRTITLQIGSDATCLGCLLHMTHVAASRCVPPGFRAHVFPTPSWFNSSLPDCAGATGPSYPLEAWNCADVEVRAAACNVDTDGDGLDVCVDLCPEDNPNDVNEDGICDSKEKMLVVYYASWARFRPEPYRLMATEIDARYFTHINWAFAVVDDEYQVRFFEPLDGTDGTVADFHEHVRGRNSHISTLITIGGAIFNHREETKYIFTNMVAAAESRAVFINSAIAFARKHGFSGIDLDWEFPGLASTGGRPGDKANFATLVQELRVAITQDAVARRQAPLLLSVAVSAGLDVMAGAYDWAAIHPHVDWFNLMTYDYNGPWAAATGANTPMAQGGTLNIPATTGAVLDAGVPASKIVLGMASYGRGWTLQSSADNGYGAPATAASVAGRYTGEAGLLAYYEIQALVADPDAVVVYHEPTQTKYVALGTTWVSYDDNTTIAHKAQHVKDLGLAGAMLWTIDMDLPLAGTGAVGHPISQAIRANLPIPTAKAAEHEHEDHTLHRTLLIVGASVGVGFVLAMVCGLMNRRGDWESMKSAVDKLDDHDNSRFRLDDALQLEHAEQQRFWYERELRRLAELDRQISGEDSMSSSDDESGGSGDEYEPESDDDAAENSNNRKSDHDV